MDLSRFLLDPALEKAVGAQDVHRSMYFEKLLSDLFEGDENLFVKTDIELDRAIVFTFPAFYWLLKKRNEGIGVKALYLGSDRAIAEKAWKGAHEIAEGIGGIKPALLHQCTSEAAAEADVLFACVEDFYAVLAESALSPRSYGFLTIDGAEEIAETPHEFQRRLMGTLLPAWERKTLIITKKHTPKAKNFAWDFADNPKEIKLAEAMSFAGSADTTTIELKSEEKIRYLIKILQEEGAHHLCAFCNLKSTAQDLAARLTINGVANDYIVGNLNPERKKQIISKASSWNGAPANSRFPADAFVLVLTDDGAKGVSAPVFPVLVNMDIPLEPELYFERLNFLDRESDSAKLYNFVCERYQFGLPAIQRSLGVALEKATPDPTVALPKDASAGQEIRLPEPGDRFGHRIEDSRPERSDRLGKPRKPQSVEAPPAIDPYKMTMEERLAFYRNKYGKSLDNPASAAPRRRQPDSRERRPKPAGGFGAKASIEQPNSPGQDRLSSPIQKE